MFAGGKSTQLFEALARFELIDHAGMNVAGMVTQPSPTPSDDLAISKYTDDMIESSMIQNNVSVKKEVSNFLNNI